MPWIDELNGQVYFGGIASSVRNRRFESRRGHVIDSQDLWVFQIGGNTLRCVHIDLLYSIYFR